MEIYEYDEEFDQSISAKFIGIGETGASASDYFGEVGNDLFPERLIVSNKDDVAGLQAKIARVDYLFVIMDIEDLELAAKVAKSIEKRKTTLGYQFPLTTFGILCPSAADARLADIPKNFDTWIIFPKDKIAECGLTSNELINRTINVTASLVLKYRFKSLNPRELNYLFSMDILDVIDTIGNFGKACIGFGKSFDAENPALDAVKKALQSPLFIEDIGKAKKILLVFVVRRKFFLSATNLPLQTCEAGNFLHELINPDPEDTFPILFQVLFDETFGDGVTAFVLATNFDE